MRLIKCIARWLVHIFLCSKLYWKFGTLLSEQARSMVSMVSLPAGRWIAERDPRRHMIADLRREKLSLDLIQCV